MFLESDSVEFVCYSMIYIGKIYHSVVSRRFWPIHTKVIRRAYQFDRVVDKSESTVIHLELMEKEAPKEVKLID